MKFELDYIEKLVNMVSESNLTELALEDSDKAIIIRKENAVVSAQTIVPHAAAHVSHVPVMSAAAVPTSQAANEVPAETPKGTPITSPMVGTFYSAPSPGAKPFVNVGETVSTGQVVCIIEAMKLMNEIESEVSGKIIKICAEDGQPVEYGQVLMYVE